MTRPATSAKAGFWPRPADIPKDLGAGITVALVSVAEGMAYALVAASSPIYGLYAGSVTVIVGSLFASSTLLMVTATNALALVAADKIGALGPRVDPAAAMFTLTLLVGVVMLALGCSSWVSLVRVHLCGDPGRPGRRGRVADPARPVQGSRRLHQHPGCQQGRQGARHHREHLAWHWPT